MSTTNVFRLTVRDVQECSTRLIGRRLTAAELRDVQHMIERGLEWQEVVDIAIEHATQQ